MASSSGLSTVDAGEVARHADLKHDWWKPRGSIIALHSLNYLRIPYIIEGITSGVESKDLKMALSNKKILDIGCGGGLLSEGLAKLGAKVTGIDPSEELINLAREHCKGDPNINNTNEPKYLCTTIEEHAQSFQNHYDAVVASEVISHAVNHDLFIKSCIQVLKPQGKIFITAPNKTRVAQFLGIYLAENIFKIVAKGLHDYDKFISPEGLTQLLQKYNCKVDNTYGLFYYPLINKWQWVFFNQLWYALQATKIE